MASEGCSVQLACRVLAVSESGFYARRQRPPSARAIRHAALTDLIGRIHLDSRGTYGARRVHAELTLGHGWVVRPRHRGVADAARRGRRGDRTSALPAHPRHGDGIRPRRTTLRTRRSRPAVGDRHRAPRGAHEPCDDERTPPPVRRRGLDEGGGSLSLRNVGEGGQQPRQRRDGPAPSDGPGPASDDGKVYVRNQRPNAPQVDPTRQTAADRAVGLGCFRLGLVGLLGRGVGNRTEVEQDASPCGVDNNSDFRPTAQLGCPTGIAFE